MQNMQSVFLLISHVARLSFTSQWLKIFSESLVIKVSNSNSKEEQIRIWTSYGLIRLCCLKLRFGDFDDLPFVFLQSFVSTSGLGRGPGAEHHSDGPGVVG